MSGRFGRVFDDIARAARGGKGGSSYGARVGSVMTLEGEIRQKSSIGDRIAFSLGFILAVGSMAFLAYAFHTSGERPQSAFSMPTITAGPSVNRASVARPMAASDPGQTGTLTPATETGEGARTGALKVEAKTKPTGYTLRKAFPGFAILDGPNGQKDVVPGVELPGAGRVLAIKQIAGEWVVETTEGLIGPAPR